MKFDTKLWKRSKKSFATTIPHIALLSIDEKKQYNVLWEFNEEIQKWTINLQEKEKTKLYKLKKRRRRFNTKLWKRSSKSYATTIPHIALLSMDENKEYNVVWEYNEKLKRWPLVLKEKNEK